MKQRLRYWTRKFPSMLEKYKRILPNLKKPKKGEKGKEEKLIKKEEERRRQEEFERIAEEEKRLKRERKKEKILKKKQEGKLLTGKQKEEARKLEAMRNRYLPMLGACHRMKKLMFWRRIKLM